MDNVADNRRKDVPFEEGLTVEYNEISSPVLSRLIEEVRQEKSNTENHLTSYNRTHNRHNRGR